MQRFDSPPIKRKVVITSSTNHNTSTQLKNAHTQITKRKRDFLNRINYSNALTAVVLPGLSVLYLCAFYPNHQFPNVATWIFTFIYFNFTILAFTCGYHKYYAHNSFSTNSLILQLYFVIFGSSIGLGPIRWWASLHRAHHRFTDDTERDPYSIKRGLLWAHWGWLLKKPKIVTFYEEFMEQEFPKFLKPIDISNDLNEVIDNNEFNLNDVELNTPYNFKLVSTQSNFYMIYFIVTSIMVPIMVAKFVCKDSILNGVLFPGILRMFCSQQCILLTESICHKPMLLTIPGQPFNEKNSSQNCHNPLISILTFGQSYQNYHHEFPRDYRNNSSVLMFDPTKWCIWTLYQIGLIEDLCKTPTELETQLRVQQQQLVINRAKSQLNWGTPISKLPLITPRDFKRIMASSNHSDRCYIVISNIIHDITPFMEQHPGGVQLLKASHGKDATSAFFGGVYRHSTAASNLLATMRIGVLDVGNDEEVWRRAVKEEGNIQDGESRKSGQYRTAEAA
ncbi:acyl-CoA desaturase 1 [[Candida] anglica]|uniref:Acyl-CoA desaturase n=1 Tax=[Candida] anglica TaxID=148631 RepID=A0ABP0EG51_9ASCO